jgi:Ser/Thr protein kinase RdoA (MazF antagonist)
MRKAASESVQDKPGPRQDAHRAIAATVVRRHLGLRARRLQPLTGGLNNHIFRLEANGRSLVVRMHDAAGQLAVYRREAWAMAQARRAGVPTPQVLEVGREGERPFMILEEAPGIPGTHWSDTVAVLRQLGKLAARLHQVRTEGFGRALGRRGQGERGWPRWSDFLEHELQIEERLRLLDEVNALPRPARETLDTTLARMRRWSRHPVLHHGDLRLKNVIVSPEDGSVVALIDWEDCLSAPAPHWDLAIALHDVGPDEKEAFLQGYGLSPARFARIAPDLRALNVLNYAWAIRQALDDGQRQRAAWLKARLRGVFDLAV